MRISAGLAADEPQVTIDDIEAQHLQPWMLYREPDSGRVFVVAADPEPFVPADVVARPHRWVSVPLLGLDEPLSAPATDRVDIIYGAPLDGLQPLLDDDLYTSEGEALARNGMCPELVDVEGVDESVWCGLPSDPESCYRCCVGHDQERRAESDDLVQRGFTATYAVIAGPVA